MPYGTPSSPRTPAEAPPDEREPELLSLGSDVPGRRLSRTVVVLVGAVVLVAGGLLAWRVVPRPDAPMTLEELQGVYAGMVRSDGTNDASVLERRNANPADVQVTPTECQPLFESTTFNQYPADALDGVGTYWLSERFTISLVTFRFPDTDTADQVYEAIDDALDTCAGRQVTVIDTGPTIGTVSRTEVDTRRGVRRQLGYTFTPDGGSSRYAVHLLEFNNTVTWQFRYVTGQREYSPLPAQQLTDGLVLQMQAVQDLRVR